MNHAMIFDGRNCYDLESAINNNVYYYSIGRKEIKNI